MRNETNSVWLKECVDSRTYFCEKKNSELGFLNILERGERREKGKRGIRPVGESRTERLLDGL